MLRRLSVENYALIDKLEMELSPSLNIITGETGAGKSILLGALALLLGGRSEGNAAKDVERNCVVEGVFAIEDYGLQPLFEANDLEYEPTTTIRRVISPAGKSRAYINDLPVQLNVLKELGSRLIDIHSQHQSLLIADDGFRINIVDSVAVHSNAPAKYSEYYTTLRAAERELTVLEQVAREARKEEDYIRYQLEQLTAMALREGEGEELESEHSELSHAEQIRETVSLGAETLGDVERGVLVALKSMYGSMARLGSVYPRAAEFAQRVESTYLELRDVESELSREADRIESDPQRLEAVEQRMKAIYDLQQKHHADGVDQLLEIQRGFAQRLAVITDSDEAIEALRTTIAKLREQATAEAAKISAARVKAAASIMKHVESVLAELGMPHACFVVEVSPLENLTANGADAVRFLFSANKGIVPQAVEKIASGGEISRVMLALKAQVARSTKLPTIIFDEIDTGVSGRIADKMGEIISDLGASMQVINITHLPQVASKGETHFVVYKHDGQTATTTHLRLLAREERVGEIAKMLSGSEITDAAMAQARLLLGAIHN